MSEQPSQSKLSRKTIIILTSVGALVAFLACAWLNQLYMMDSLKAYLNNLRDVAAALTQIIALVLLAGFVIMLTLWLSKSEGTIVLPFQNATGDAKYDGRGISDSLIAELQRIRQIHETEFEGVQLERERITLPAWKPNTEDVSASVADVGTIGIGDTTVSVGKLLTTLKRMWPFGEPGSLITGSIQKYGSVYRLVARMEDRSGIRTWTVTRPIKQDSEITYLIRDLAYQVANGLSPEITASYEGFECFSESLNDYSTYKRTRNADDLVRAENECLEAHRHDQNYAKLTSLFYNFGMEELDKNEYGKAVLMLEPATRLKSNDARSFVSLGYAYSELNRNEDALAAYLKAIELGGLNDLELAAVHNNLGNTYADLSRTSDALAAYLKAIALAPKFAYPQNGLGLLYITLGRTQDALAAYQRAIELDPMYATPHNGLGNAYRALGRTDDAITEYECAIKLDPKDDAPHNGLGGVYQSTGLFEKARDEFNRAVDLNPQDGALRGSLVGILKKLGREAEAAEQEEIARELIVKQNEYNRACFEAICGNIDESLALLKIALEKGPGYRVSIRRDPDFDNIRTDPRFVALVGAAD